MRRPVLIGGLVLGALGVAVLLSASSKPSAAGALPTSKRIAYRYLKPGERPQTLTFGPGVVLFDGAPIRVYPDPHPDPVARIIAFQRDFQAALAPKRAALPKDANRVNADGYALAQYYVPTWLYIPPFSPKDWEWDLTHPASAPIDEYGRPFPGHYGAPHANLWDQTFGGLLKNPLFKTVVLAALVASGPQGMAVYGAYTLWQNRGQQLTLQNVALKTARAYVVSQCGPACGAAFDFGVGVAAGKRYDKAAEDALLQQLDPAQREAYEQGKRSLKGK